MEITLTSPASDPTRTSTVVQIDPTADARWDAFVRSHPYATVYHLAAWARILREAYRYTPRYIAVEDRSGNLTGVLPLMSRTGMRGKVLRSLPGYEIGGPIGRTPQDDAMLMAAALSMAGGEAAKAHVDGFTGGLEAQASGWIAVERPSNWVLQLPADEEGLDRWAKVRHRRKLVQRIKKAAKVGVTVRKSESDDDLRVFYRMLLTNMRRKRSTPRTMHQLRLTKRLLSPGADFHLWVAEYRGRAIAARVSLTFGNTVENLHIAHDEDSLSLNPHHALNRQAMSWAVEHGFTQMSFGHAWPESSLGDFKARWGCEPVPLYGYAWRPGGVPDSMHRVPDAARTGHPGIVGWLWERTPLPIFELSAILARRYL